MAAEASWLSHLSPQRKNAEYSHGAFAPDPFTVRLVQYLSGNLPNTTLSAFKHGLEAPGQAASGTLDPFDPTQAIPAALATTGFAAAGALPGASPAFALSALRGIKRMPVFWHGTSTNPKNIFEKGFDRGGSSELNIPGTSVSEDPLVARGFAQSYEGALPPDSRILKVKPEFAPEDVANLPPSAYFSGTIPDAPAYRKPNLFFQEAETFAPRSETRAPLAAEMPTAAELARIRKEGIADARVKGSVMSFAAGKATAKDVAKSLASVRGNSGRYTGIIDNLMEEVNRNTASVPENVGELAGQASELKTYMYRLRVEVESDARILRRVANSDTPMTDRVPQLKARLQANGKLLDQAYRDYFRTRDKFVDEFNNFAYGNKPSISSPSSPQDIMP